MRQTVAVGVIKSVDKSAKEGGKVTKAVRFHYPGDIENMLTLNRRSRLEPRSKGSSRRIMHWWSLDSGEWREEALIWRMIGIDSCAFART